MQMNMTRKRPTIHDVAAAAGVSRGTVSRVLNDKGNVSLAAQTAVRRAVAETGYVVNRAARSLKTSRTGSVVMVLSEPQERLFEDPNFSVLMRVATNRFAERDVSLVLMIAGDDGGRDRVARYLRGGHADGVLLVSSHAGDPLLDDIERSGTPAVACGAVLGRESVIPYAAADDRAGARDITKYLVERGSRKIGMITGPLDTPGGSLRLEGFTEVLGRRASKQLIVNGDYTQAGGEAAMRRLDEIWPGPGGEAPAELPDSQAIAAARGHMGYTKLHVRSEPAALRKDVPTLAVDLNGIAPGFAVDLIAMKCLALPQLSRRGPTSIFHDTV
jgi:DNA-binding LacI/PurR family transcriptional regulator